ncbi:HesA/MoeB/ThiF family protein, putative [Entamoeba histolytica HM-1:IMSS-B]|uniref:HesA/MoeB/ThiF family protein, putative n=6 Tax=Entamoeba histolytica TaxID=5759 RepID=C4M2U8_ENTH1|nr:HesA/MoeB/ThiF family protein, putative [Entamoeba histolytica HM-1:IMSS]EMD49522.1 HesA/MoeB/ThiF family protein [Entamoeba histolytica KU27]EMH72872.1 HesA/MoeB/ThiF family protein, putative [Entamoeba histolytica HM-1:IMSS-B]EMS17175.1 HesA/MoeB/ThiF family protein [Entamoeba histolytica HM-3:IMSS]ENY64988.1 HesA/MoeB/ThiF family protein, putative [Entamoeba histolytica HM-1:IMSS-A]GAT95619.1 hesa moeb thif family protein putative [Entamoeba histolytica]|eukprot:XP_656656.1 HesA/MoeB/ThiF family protein, putative [Entamoeba histolytica HM-1:IMSS]
MNGICTMLSQEQRDSLKSKHILIVGLGGVGSYTAEILARCGIGQLTIVDADTISVSNINRQLPAIPSTVGQSKVGIVKQRLERINPEIEVKTVVEFLENERIHELVSAGFDYVVDAIDSVSPKVFLIKNVMEAKIPLVSSMGAGGRFDPTKIQIADISLSHKDNLTRLVRYRLHKHGIRSGFNCVFSSEEPDRAALMFHQERFKKSSFGTLSYITSMFGVKCAESVIRDLIGHPVVNVEMEKPWEENNPQK